MIDDELFEIVFNQSSSITIMCQKLGFNYKNGIITKLIRERILNQNLRIEKFKPREWDRGSVEKILVKSSRFRGNLSGLLKRFSVIPNDKCQECGINSWNQKLLVLELHHIDGDNRNNTRENLVFLCPNCHSLTENHRNKKRSLEGIIKDSGVVDAEEAQDVINEEA
jgi:5-methylcytosine-specific restriction endonuclease McrA